MQIACKQGISLHRIIFLYFNMSAKNKQKNGKDQQDIERWFAQSLAKDFPLYEAGRNVVGFLSILGSKHLTERIADLLRGHCRKMQCKIADSIKIYVLWQSIDLIGFAHVDNELMDIFDELDECILHY